MRLARALQIALEGRFCIICKSGNSLPAMTIPSETDFPTDARTARRLALAAAVAGFVIGILSAHRGLYNDGIFFIQWLSDWELLKGEKHALLYPHLFYLPTAKALHLFLNLFHPTRLDDSLRIYSAVFMGVAGPFLIRLFLTFTSPAKPAVAFLATLLVFFAPSVWYFAGATEIHTIHLAAAAFGLAAAAKPYKKFADLAFVAGAVWIQGTHLTGFFLIPPMLLLRERARLQGRPLEWAPALRSAISMGVLCALAIGAMAAAAWGLALAFPERSVLREYFAGVHPGEQNYFYTIWKELVVRSGVLVFAGMACAALSLKRDALAALAVLLTFIPYAHFIGGSQVEYQGGYNIAAAAIWPVGILLFLRWRSTVATAAVAFLLTIQIILGFAEVKQPLTRDLNRDTAEAIGAAVDDGDALILYIPPSAVDFDLTDLPKLTRLYLSRVIPNAAMLDSKNADKPPRPYLTDPEALEFQQKRIQEIDAALGASRRAFVSAEVWDPPADAPKLTAFSKLLKERYAAAEVIAGIRLVRLAKKIS